MRRRQGPMYYYVPGPAVPERVFAPDVGLAYVFDEPPTVTQVERDTAPDGGFGGVYCRSTAPLPAELVWRPLGDRGDREIERSRVRAMSVWCGWAVDAVPGPLTLARGRRPVQAGARVLLADGHRWDVPRVVPCTDRDPGRLSGLARLPVRSLADGFAFQAAPEEAALREMAAPFLAHFVEGELAQTRRREIERRGGAVPTAECLAYAAAVLGYSYRVGIGEVLALGLLDEACLRTLVIETLDGAERLLAGVARRAPEAVALFERAGEELTWTDVIGACEAGED